MTVLTLDGYSMQLLEQRCCHELRSVQQNINNFSAHGKTSGVEKRASCQSGFLAQYHIPWLKLLGPRTSSTLAHIFFKAILEESPRMLRMHAPGDQWLRAGS